MKKYFLKMKGILKFVFLMTGGILINSFTFAQNNTDVIVKHTGEKLNVKVLSVNGVITYTYPEEAVNITISKNCVKEIVFASGRVHPCTEKIVVHGRDDWAKVIITTDPEDVKCLVRKGDITASASNTWNFKSAKGVDMKAMEKIKREAAVLKAHIVLIHEQRTKGGSFADYASSSKSGVAYGYE